MKKRLLLLLIIATVAFCLCACGSYEERMTPISIDDDSDYEDEEDEESYEDYELFDIDTIPYDQIAESPDLLQIWYEKHDYWDAFEWEYVESDAILEAGYAPMFGDMAIVFTTSPYDTYVYYDVPEEIFEDMINADSVGWYYNAYVKGQYESECL